MPEPFKNMLGEAVVRGLAADVAAVHPGFPEDRFVAAALAGLDRLEMKDRVRHVARTLRATLPADWPEALDVLLAALPPADTDGGERALAAGETWESRFRLSTRPVTTRPTRPGPQRVHLRVLGNDTEPVGFELEAWPGPPHGLDGGER